MYENLLWVYFLGADVVLIAKIFPEYLFFVLLLLNGVFVKINEHLGIR